MEEVRQIKPIKSKEIVNFIESYRNFGFQANNLYIACKIIEEMIKNNATVFIGISGALVAGGLRKIISELIRRRIVDVVVTTGANVVHDLIESFGGKHYYNPGYSDEELKEKGYGRIGSVVVKMEDFVKFEKSVQKIIDEIPEKERENMSIKELLWFIGSRIDDKDSILRCAYEKKVPIFCPGVADSMLGLQLFLYSERKKLVLNCIKDMKELIDIAFTSEKTGAIILGGGLPKHYIMGANLLRDGLDYAVQITLDREEHGGLSGAKLSEGISWSKVKAKAKFANIVSEVTLIFPLIASYIISKTGGESDS